MNGKEKIISLAVAELGYCEKWQNQDLDSKTAYAGSGNFTKYARDLDAIEGFYNGKKNGYAWCDMFVDWLFVKCFGAETALRMLYQPWGSAGAGCTYSLGYYRKNNAFYSSPQPGDQIFFGSIGDSYHTGLVVAVTSDAVTTIEGNSSDMVQRRTYKRGDSCIAGYGRPNWLLAEDASLEPEPSNLPANIPTTLTIGCVITVPELEKGCRGDAVKALQRLLNGVGCSVGIFGADGDFGSATEKALIKFQTANGLEADGICGSKTWTKLIGG